MSVPDFTVYVPGKVILLGEYAVLDGAPAVVMAVNRGVKCEVWRKGPLTIETPETDSRFVKPALQSIRTNGRFRFTAWNPPAGADEKVGLGSSAAACVAAVTAGLTNTRQNAEPPTVFQMAKKIHHDVQGSGSGIDVAASAFGGILRYENGAPTPLPFKLPYMSVVWSGTSAKTGPRVLRYQSWSERRAFVQASTKLSTAFLADPIGNLHASRRLLEDMSKEAGIDYMTPRLTLIADLAESYGGAAKPSGAGGGDIAVAAFPSADAKQLFLDACAQHRIISIPVVPYPTPPQVRFAESTRRD